MGMKTCECGAECSPSYTADKSEMNGWFCAECGTFTPVIAADFVPSCPNCGHSVTTLTSTATKVWDKRYQGWLPYTFGKNAFTCSHCNLEEYQTELVMRESSG